MRVKIQEKPLGHLYEIELQAFEIEDHHEIISPRVQTRSMGSNSLHFHGTDTPLSLISRS